MSATNVSKEDGLAFLGQLIKDLESDKIRLHKTNTQKLYNKTWDGQDSSFVEEITIKMERII
jgi:hypothetical protein